MAFASDAIIPPEMVCGSNVWGSPPPEATARVEETAEGTRVTLRPLGAGRWLAVAFLAVWLAGWAAGEFFAGAFLLRIVGAAAGLAPSSLPTGAGVLLIGAFLLVWLIFWTLGGAAAAMTIARLGWGTDVLTVGAGGCTLWQGVGRWGRTRQLDVGSVRRVSLRRGDGDLIAELDGRTLALTTYGTAADRHWLCEVLRKSLGVGESAELSVTPPVILPLTEPNRSIPGYRVDPLPDGTSRVMATAGRRAGQAGCLFFFALFWNGVLSVFFLAGFGVIPLEGHSGGPMAPGHWLFWLCLSPFTLIGAGLMTAFLWSAFGREEWRLSPDRLEVWRAIPGRCWVRQYTGATLALDVRTDSDGDESWRLVLESSGEKRDLESGDPSMLRALGSLIADQTGWRLREPETT